MYIQVVKTVTEIKNQSQNQLKFLMNINQEKQACLKYIILKHVKNQMIKI
jgi:hypothetical protein